MTKKINLLDIVKSKLSNKENLPAWHEKRLKICGDCSWNSENKPKKEQTVKEKSWVLLNGGKPTCLACKCQLDAKTSIPHAICGLNSIGLEPKWLPVDTIKKNSNVEIENISTTPLKIYEKNNETYLDYGKIKVGQETDVQILIRDINNNITDVSVSSSCGCTVPKTEKKNGEILLKIKYNTKIEGDFTKTVIFSYKQNNIKYNKIFKITGKTI